MKTTPFLFFLTALILVNITGLYTGVFLSDSSLYAQISNSFITSHNWWDIYVNGHDWLDKPHFPFWLCAISMQLFGINSFAYKLPSILLFLASLFYTYKLTEKLYNKKTARIAVLMLASSVHIIISNNDTRAEAILIGLIMGSVYHLFSLSQRYATKHLLLGSMFCAMAIMTKGIFVLIIVFSAVFGHLLLKKEYAKLLQIKWLLVFVLTAIFILPELYALYTQFDLHPEKIVFGKTQESGIKFFLWDSQFGRFVNTGPIKGNGDPFFFFHTLLWAFAPWAIVGYMALFNALNKLAKRKQMTEYVSICGFLIMFIVFSASQFQLPHYTNILFPFLSIMCAKYIMDNKDKKWLVKTFRVSQIIYIGVYFVMLSLIIIFFRADNWVLTGLIIIASCISLVFVLRKFNTVILQFFSASLVCTMMFLLYLNLVFYPKLLTYQSAGNAAEYVNAHYPHNTVVNTFEEPLMEFTAKNNVGYINDNDLSRLKSTDQNGKIIYYADQHFLDTLQTTGIRYHKIETFYGYHITKLKKDFFYYKTREHTLEPTFLIEIKNNNPISIEGEKNFH